jgi:hypothetical protein
MEGRRGTIGRSAGEKAAPTERVIHQEQGGSTECVGSSSQAARGATQQAGRPKLQAGRPRPVADGHAVRTGRAKQFSHILSGIGLGRAVAWAGRQQRGCCAAPRQLPHTFSTTTCSFTAVMVCLSPVRSSFSTSCAAQRRATQRRVCETAQQRGPPAPRRRAHKRSTRAGMRRAAPCRRWACRFHPAQGSGAFVRGVRRERLLRRCVPDKVGAWGARISPPPPHTRQQRLLPPRKAPSPAPGTRAPPAHPDGPAPSTGARGRRP